MKTKEEVPDKEMVGVVEKDGDGDKVKGEEEVEGDAVEDREKNGEDEILVDFEGLSVPDTVGHIERDADSEGETLGSPELDTRDEKETEMDGEGV